MRAAAAPEIDLPVGSTSQPRIAPRAGSSLEPAASARLLMRSARTHGNTTPLARTRVRMAPLKRETVGVVLPVVVGPSSTATVAVSLMPASEIENEPSIATSAVARVSSMVMRRPTAAPVQLCGLRRSASKQTVPVRRPVPASVPPSPITVRSELAPVSSGKSVSHPAVKNAATVPKHKESTKRRI